MTEPTCGHEEELKVLRDMKKQESLEFTIFWFYFATLRVALKLGGAW